jgi:hypothetical protein
VLSQAFGEHLGRVGIVFNQQQAHVNRGSTRSYRPAHELPMNGFIVSSSTDF